MIERQQVIDLQNSHLPILPQVTHFAPTDPTTV